ncbi:uncharacterized protein LOC111073909 [Drosophila obscura]|uniref:uncharacterized protein LOC111073909 n=1 Tax=Drosophila obscura TaxID=7282 RepID=UPI001BB23807|nr:uncharacterized protein LOC111073909 [Drosophila obscura]XP_022222174.2 uncharacterized protein LOC111073909 [Drosophila obscura]
MDARATIGSRKTLGPRRSIETGTAVRYSRWSSVFTIDENFTAGFPEMCLRHPKDKRHIVPDYQDVPEEFYDPKFTPPYCDDLEMFIDPDFATFHVPLYVRCLERYGEAKRLYNRQLNREIRKHIDNQPTADCAWQFVRTMAYTTLWPPLHTREELKLFEKGFCKLSPAEKRHYDRIMKTTFT